MPPSPPPSVSLPAPAGLNTSARAAKNATAAIGGAKGASAPTPTARISRRSPRTNTSNGKPSAPPPAPPPTGLPNGPALPDSKTLSRLETLAQSLYREHGALEVEAVVNGFCIVITNNGQFELDWGHWLMVRLPGPVTDSRATRVQIVKEES